MTAQIIPKSRYLCPNYFMSYEMSMGGRYGGYFTSSHGRNYKIQGAALGLGFGKNITTYCGTPLAFDIIISILFSYFIS